MGKVMIEFIEGEIGDEAVAALKKVSEHAFARILCEPILLDDGRDMTRFVRAQRSSERGWTRACGLVNFMVGERASAYARRALS